MKNIELISELSSRLHWEQEETERMMDAFCEVIGDKLASSDIVSLHGLGQFEAKKKDERFLANPINNKRYLIPPKLVPVFKPVATLKAYLKTLDSHG